MTLRLYLVRHAIATERDDAQWPDDSERPLIREGVRSFKKAAVGLATIASIPDAVFSSPARRAWQTAELLTGIGWPSPEVLAALLPGGDPRDILTTLPADGQIALVGHAPDLAQLASLLLSGAADVPSIEMKKGAVLALEVDQTTASASLKWLAQPSMLRRLG